MTLPPGPRSPAVWQLLRYSTHSIPYIERCARRFGTPFTLKLHGYGPFVLLTDAAAVRDVFRADPTVLHSGEGNEFLSMAVGPSSVLVLDEGRHARQRAALVPAVRGERTRAMLDAMQAEAAAAVDAWPVGRPFRAIYSMRRIALRVILRSALGFPPGPALDRMEHLVESLMRLSRNRHTIAAVGLLPRALITSALVLNQQRLRRLNRALYDEIARRRGGGAGGADADSGARPPNTLDDLLAARDERGEPFPEQELRDAIVTMIFAGYDTTAVALAWALEQIVPREAVVERIRAEAAAAAPENPKRPYLEAAIKESLRVRTIFPFVVRVVKKPLTAGGQEYLPDTTLCPCIHLIHRRPDLYPDPERFDPERFLVRSFGADEWLPFGGGNRTCIGMAFALAEMKVILGTILTRVRLARPAGAMSRPVRHGLAMGPHDGCRLVRL